MIGGHDNSPFAEEDQKGKAQEIPNKHDNQRVTQD